MSTRLRLTENLTSLRAATSHQPYSITHRLDLAQAYKELGYPDLAAGDAYKALLLIDEVLDEGEFHDEAQEAAKSDYLVDAVNHITAEEGEEKKPNEDHIVTWVKDKCSRIAYDVLIKCLLDCGNLRTVFDYIARARTVCPDETMFEEHDATLSAKLRAHFRAKEEDIDEVDIEEYPDKGLVRREQYPWNEHEPDRSSPGCLQFLNGEMANVAPRLEVKLSRLPLLSTSTPGCSFASEVAYVQQLGVFATDDIAPGEDILQEKSLLTAISRLHDSYCDACSIALPNMRAMTKEAGHDRIFPCEECEEVFFCSMDCHDLAQDSYHPSLCGVDVDQGQVPAGEAADSLYTLLLIRALAMAETQNLHPLELKELRYVWGDYHGHDLESMWNNDPVGADADTFCYVPKTLPFSFKSNVLTPLHILEKMDVNIFTQSHRYDTWVFNTIYAKLRGTASAQQGLDGRPEIGAVHPMWCLANHSCDPNVAWEWQGSMRFWTREELVDWKGPDPGKGPGIKKGEEIFSHYCDVRLPVKERREWAIGALGGECMCQRCVWEENEENLRNTVTS